MSLFGRLLSSREETRFGVDDYVSMLNDYQFSPGVQQTLTGQPTEAPPVDFAGLVSSAYKANGVVFACMLVRQSVFSGVRFTYQRLHNGRGADMWGDKSLSILERPWYGGTTQDLLTKMIQDADLAGNAYIVRLDGSLVRLRPDWVRIALEPRKVRGVQVGWEKLGYLYYEGGYAESKDPAVFLPNEVAHFAPIPDPTATYRGMSWLTPIVREIQADRQMTLHKSKYFDNGATPNMVVSYPEKVRPQQVREFRDKMNAEHAGANNAYKTLHLGMGADLTVVGSNLQQIDFRQVQGAGETRIAAAAGVPPVIVGLSEGLQAATYSNYGQARRRFADGTMHTLWGNVAGSLETLVPAPPSKFRDGDQSRLWYDSRDVPFLREDEKDAAEIQGRRAATIKALLDAGFTPESVVSAVDADDMRMLVHSGLYSVQLQAPGALGGVGGDPAAPAQLTEAERARLAVEAVQKVYLGVGVLISEDEARELVRRAAGDALPPTHFPSPPTDGGING